MSSVLVADPTPREKYELARQVSLAVSAYTRWHTQRGLAPAPLTLHTAAGDVNLQWPSDPPLT